MNMKDEVMGDKITINNSVIGAVGNGAVNYGNVTSSSEKYDYGLMYEEIIRLKNVIQSLPQSDQQTVALSTIVQAAEAASTQNGVVMISALKRLGAWVFNVARDIGMNVIANFIAK